MAETSQLDPVLTPDEVSEHYKISTNTLKKWRQTKGGGPVFIRMGRHVRYRVADLKAWQDELARAAEAD